MSTARTFVRFVFAGFFVNALAVACVVSDADDNGGKDACSPGVTQDCDCQGAEDGTQKCNASGSGYGVCDCPDNVACEPGVTRECACATDEAGQQKCAANGSGYGVCDCPDTGAGGSTGKGGEGGAPTTGTAGSTTYGGDGGATTSQAGSGGEGGADPAADVCIDDDDDCQACIQIDCCEAWSACAAETAGDCELEVLEIMACTSLERGEDDPVTRAELQACGVSVGEGSGGWSDDILPTTKAVIDCVAGGSGWVARDDLTTSSCNLLCFAAE